ncbi:unnamed protein product, partial [marine sediment metagenome]
MTGIKNLMRFIKNLKGFLDKINIFDWYLKSRDYESLYSEHQKQTDNNITLAGKVGRLTQRVNNISNDLGIQRKNNNTLTSELFKYHKGIKETSEYKELQAEKEKAETEKKQVEQEKNHYKNESEGRGKTIIL